MCYFSVVMATYNGERFIAEQIESIIGNFNYSKLVKEFIITDDGSSDNTLEIISKYSENPVNKIKVVRNDTVTGVISNFCNGIEVSTGEYVILADQDDLWVKDKLETLFKHTNHFEGRDKPLVLISDSSLIDSSNKTIANSFFRENNISANRAIRPESLVVKNFAQGCVMLFSSDFKELVDFERRDNWIMHDWWFMLVASKNANICVIDKPLTRYRIHSSNLVGIQSHGFLNKLINLRDTITDYKKSLKLRLEQCNAYNFQYNSKIRISPMDFIFYESTLKRKLLATVNLSYIKRIYRG